MPKQSLIKRKCAIYGDQPEEKQKMATNGKHQTPHQMRKQNGKKTNDFE